MFKLFSASFASEKNAISDGCSTVGGWISPVGGTYRAHYGTNSGKYCNIYSTGFKSAKTFYKNILIWNGKEENGKRKIREQIYQK